MPRPIVSAALAAMLLATSPGAAAAFPDRSAVAGAPSAFGGVAVRVPLDGGQQPASARLQLTVRPAGAPPPRGPAGLELGASRDLTPRLFVAGREARDMRRELGINGSTTTVLVVGGAVVVLGLAALLLFTDDPDSEPCIPGNC